jgi:hypothetical protein
LNLAAANVAWSNLALPLNVTRPNWASRARLVEPGGAG